MRKQDQLKMFGCQLRRTRKRKGVNLAELSEKMDHTISVQSLSAYESGKRSCSLPRLFELCAALEVTPTELLGYASDPHGAVELDLRTVLEERDPDLATLQRWAAARLCGGGAAPTVFLDRSAVELIAEISGVSCQVMLEKIRKLS